MVKVSLFSSTLSFYCLFHDFAKTNKFTAAEINKCKEIHSIHSVESVCEVCWYQLNIYTCENIYLDKHLFLQMWNYSTCINNLNSILIPPLQFRFMNSKHFSNKTFIFPAQ